MDMIMKEVIKLIGQKLHDDELSDEMRRLYHSSASMPLMRTTTNII